MELLKRKKILTLTGNIYFTADTHFNHANIIRFCNRPFDDVLEMNEIIIQKWNEKIKPNSIVYHLGDFAFGEAGYIKDSLNGKITLIKGSHEKSAYACRNKFEQITPLLEIDINNTTIVLCHYSMRTWHKSHYNSWHLYGHSHGKLEGWGKSFDVGVDSWNFTPLSYEEIREEMKNRPDNFNLLKEAYLLYPMMR